MGARFPDASPRFVRALSTAETQIRLAPSTSKIAAKDSSWTKWEQFCQHEGVNKFLVGIADPIAYLLVFAVLYREGSASKSGNTVRASTVDDVLRDISQKMAELGYTDYRLLPNGHLDYRLSQLKKSWNKADPPSERVQPVSLAILRELCKTAGGNRMP